MRKGQVSRTLKVEKDAFGVKQYARSNTCARVCTCACVWVGGKGRRVVSQCRQRSNNHTNGLSSQFYQSHEVWAGQQLVNVNVSHKVLKGGYGQNR